MSEFTKMTQFSVLEYIAMILLGILCCRFLVNLFKFAYTFFIGPLVNKVDFKSKGQWAIITGCTDGIGKEYARQLAARGCDIVLISRSMAKLKETAAEIEQEYKVATKSIQVDFNEDDNIYDKIRDGISGLQIGTLVNNVGVCYPYPEFFLDVPDWDTIIPMIMKVNTVSVTRLTRLVLPQMLKRGKGVIINVGSVSSLVPNPMFAVYSASKLYMKKFTEDLILEYANRGVIFQCSMPGYVVTKMSGLEKSSFAAPTPKTYVQSALSLVGTSSITTGYLPHALVTYFFNSIYSLSSSLGARLMLKNMKAQREREIKKLS